MKKSKKNNDKALKITVGTIVGVMAISVATALLVKFDVFNIHKQEYTSTASLVEVMESKELDALLKDVKVAKENVPAKELADNYTKASTMLYMHDKVTDKYNITINLKNELLEFEEKYDVPSIYVFDEKINDDQYLCGNILSDEIMFQHMNNKQHTDALSTHSNFNLMNHAFFNLALDQHVINEAEIIDVYETINFKDLEITKVVRTYETIIEEKPAISSVDQYIVTGNLNIQDKVNISKVDYDELCTKVLLTKTLKKRLNITE